MINIITDYFAKLCLLIRGTVVTSVFSIKLTDDLCKQMAITHVMKFVDVVYSIKSFVHYLSFKNND